MNARAAHTGHRKRDTLQPPTLDDQPVTEGPCPDDQRCPSTHPLCPAIRCGRHIHRADVSCTASGYAPHWWSAFWTRPPEEQP